MGLFDKLKGGSNKPKNYAKMYLDAMAKKNVDKAEEIFEEWSAQPDCENDANYMLVKTFYEILKQKPYDEIDELLKKAYSLEPVDPSQHGLIRMMVDVRLMKPGYEGLMGKYAKK
ncbi:MAG: hypothetical protein IJL02_05960 [Methanobrevibacter sp.]|uniref:hypothetical protein n=1 Tax=Methanobrevibacter sp. TaxID=66852 RepID=UPI0025D6ED61|nr:hypothetical protein [Methanobrevibacter sp.]MBQ6099392.1 hypothetical protein [Methanobrevibacter sp.]